MKQLLFTLLILIVSTQLFGQIKTSEIEVRAPTTSTVNEIEGETRIIGRVGIGTSETPAGRMEIVHTGSSELVLRGDGQNYGNAGLVLKATQESTNQRSLGVFMHDKTGGNEWFAGRPYGNSDSYVIYRNPLTTDHTQQSSARNTASHATGVEAWMTILNNGNVGIGTVSPSKRFEVIDDVNVVSRFTSSTARVSLMLRDINTSNGVGISGVSDDLQVLTGSGSGIAATFTAAKNLGINVTDPKAKLHTRTGNATNFTWSPKSGTSAIFESSSTNRNFLTILAPAHSELWFADSLAQNAGKVRYVHSSDRMEFWTNNLKRVSIIDGNMGIGTQTPSVKLQVEGDIMSTNMHSHSDRRWKKDITDISDVGETLNEIHPVSYRWRVDEFKEKDFDHKLHYGVIAQELEKVLPELVSTDNEGYKSVDYLGMIGLLIKGFQERGEKIEQLEAKLSQRADAKSTTDELESLKTRMAKLEAFLEKQMDAEYLEINPGEKQ